MGWQVCHYEPIVLSYSCSVSVSLADAVLPQYQNRGLGVAYTPPLSENMHPDWRACMHLSIPQNGTQRYEADGFCLTERIKTCIAKKSWIHQPRVQENKWQRHKWIVTRQWKSKTIVIIYMYNYPAQQWNQPNLLLCVWGGGGGGGMCVCMCVWERERRCS